MSRSIRTSPRRRPGDIDDDVADWFEGTSAAEVAAAVAGAVEQEATVTIADQDAARAAAYRDRRSPTASARNGLLCQSVGTEPPTGSTRPGVPGSRRPDRPGGRIAPGRRAAPPGHAPPATRTSRRHPEQYGRDNADRPASAWISGVCRARWPLVGAESTGPRLFLLPIAVVGAGRLGTAVGPACTARGRRGSACAGTTCRRCA